MTQQIKTEGREERVRPGCGSVQDENMEGARSRVKGGELMLGPTINWEQVRPILDQKRTKK